MREIAEAVALAENQVTPDLSGTGEIEGGLRRLDTGSVLDDQELLALARTLAVAATACRALRNQRQLAPSLAARAKMVPDLSDPARRILDCYTPQEILADHASPGLRTARTRTGSLRTRVAQLMEQAMERYADLLQDKFTTLRDGRWVLPVRADAHERLQGIVHGASQSGATLFVEPESVVPVANQLRVALAAVEREEMRVRSRLTDILRSNADELCLAVDGLTAIDLKLAAGELARELDLRPPRLVKEPVLRLVKACHPLLLLGGKEVVASDFSVESQRALVISGPNSGGKTVTLKTACLLALMTRAGLPLPASEESEVGLFGNILADIGDGQSLDLSLSTFSARMVALAEILARAGKGDLVGLDEICAGTDPDEGASLAASVVEELVEKGVAVITTTHYPVLKDLAIRDEKMTCASVGFDAETLAPTFRLIVGTPGPSAALQVARRCGVPAAVVNRARNRIPEAQRELSDTAHLIHAAARKAERARKEAEDRLREAEAARQAAAQELREGRQKGKHQMLRQAREVMETVKRVRKRVMEAEAQVRRRRVRKKDVVRARKALGEVAGSVSPGSTLAEALAPAAPRGRPAEEKDLVPGARVWVSGMNHEATVIAAADRGKIKVASGSLQLLVKVADLLVIGSPTTGKESRSAGARDSFEDDSNPVQTPENTLDIRGIYAGEAEEPIERFLDRLLREERAAGFLIHGHGSGALRNAVRRYLSGSPYVSRHRPGAPSEGGDGVTVVWIR